MIERKRYLPSKRTAIDYPASGIELKDSNPDVNRYALSHILGLAIRHGEPFTADNDLDAFDTYAGQLESQTRMPISENISLGRVFHLGPNREAVSDKTQGAIHALGEVGLQLFVPRGAVLMADVVLRGIYRESEDGNVVNDCDLTFKFTSDNAIELGGIVSITESIHPDLSGLWQQLKLDALVQLEEQTIYTFAPRNQMETEPLGSEQVSALVDYIDDRTPRL